LESREAHLGVAHPVGEDALVVPEPGGLGAPEVAPRPDDGERRQRQRSDGRVHVRPAATGPGRRPAVGRGRARPAGLAADGLRPPRPDRGAQTLPAARRQLARLQPGHQRVRRQRALAPLEGRVPVGGLGALAPAGRATFLVHLPASRAPRIFSSARLILLFTVPSGRPCRAASSECDQPPKKASSTSSLSPSSRTDKARAAISAGTGSGSADIATWYATWCSSRSAATGRERRALRRERQRLRARA